MKAVNQELLQNKEVVEEINRHRWLESEKAGHDIGFEMAAEDWLNHFSSAWMKFHFPQRKQEAASKTAKAPKTEKPANAPKTRRASTYYQ